MNTRKLKKICIKGKPILLLAPLFFFASPAHAGFYAYGTGQTTCTASGCNSQNANVNAKVTFDIISSDQMIVTLTNLETNIVSVGQDISSLFFNVNNASSTLDLSKATVTISGQEVNVTQNPSGPGGIASSVGTLNATVGYTGASITTSNETTATHWSKDKYGLNGVTPIANNQMFLNDLNSGGAPAQTILGPASNGNYGNMYSSVNSSIYGNGPHNPFIQYQAKFKITTAPGLLANAQVNNVQIGFGTAAGCYVPTHKVPEPGMLSLFALGAAALGFSRRKSGHT